MGFCGLEEDEKKAHELLEAAAKGGHAQAQLDLADWYKEGTVVSQNSKKAFKLYELASETGLNEATVELAICYSDGIGVEQNEKTAFKNRIKALEKGVHDWADEACAQVGHCLVNGDNSGLFEVLDEVHKKEKRYLWARLSQQERDQVAKLSEERNNG